MGAQLSRLGKPVDRTLWEMTPQTVNAYYDPTHEPGHLPGRDLQPPFFDAAADPAVNYGETGATIGHEMGHGFDDEGRQFDAQGRCATGGPSSRPTATTSTPTRSAKQFDAYEPIPGVHIKGQLTLGENLGDLGGLEAAYAAYQRYVARHGEPPVIDGYTGDQRFFLAYAQAGRARRAKARYARSYYPIRTAPSNIGSTASSGTSTHGTRRSTSSPATSCTFRPSSGCTSGRRDRISRKSVAPG